MTVATVSRRRGAGAPAGGSPPTRRRGARWWPFAAPAVLVVVGLYLIPLLLNGILAFTNWSGFSSEISFTGIENLRTLVDQNSLVAQIRLTLVYAVTASVVANGLSLPLALALEKPTRLNVALRAVYFLPVLLSPLAAGYVWAGIFDAGGPLNRVLGLFSSGVDTAWLGEPSLAIFLVAAVDGWKWSGFFTLVYIAALTTVPTDLKDAARTDGAGAFAVFRHVKLPFLAPAFTYNITVTVIGAMSAFDIVVAMTGGGPGNATRVLNVLTSDQFGAGYFGLASMTSLVVTVLVIATAVPLVRALRRRELEA